jgi:hypothetical protein
MLGLINQLAIARASGGVGGARGQRNNFLLALFSNYRKLCIFQCRDNFISMNSKKNNKYCIVR